MTRHEAIPLAGDMRITSILQNSLHGLTCDLDHPALPEWLHLQGPCAAILPAVERLP